ncbi:hypothetical protein PHPALM_28260, partial [Phytophthora palmivora]
MDSTTFAVPGRLLTSRKRCAECPSDVDSDSFFTADAFATFSTHGDIYKSRRYGELETRRRTIVTPGNASDSSSKSSSTMNTMQQSKHLVQLLVEAIESHRIRAPEKMLELDNARRRLSGFSVAQHERYLVLQRKVFQAQQRGLPEVLSLSQDEAKQWQEMKAEVEKEQVGFCRMMTRGLAAEDVVNQAQVPSFVGSWYNSMLTQCWNDVYRLYPRWFEPCVAVKLPSDDATCDTASAVLRAEEVAARGTYCVIDITNLRAGQSLKNSPDEGGELVMDVVSPRQAISADPTSRTIDGKVQLRPGHFFVYRHISSLRPRGKYNSSTKGWGIPMKSRAIIHGSDGATKKRVYLDRPLPGSNPSSRDKVAEAGRAALLSRFETESVIEESTGGRTAYHVWQLNDSRILVRSTTHASMFSPSASTGIIPPENASQDQQKQQATTPLSVFVKPDYHSLGVEEQLTTSERCRFWLHSWLRGGSTVLVARVNPKEDTIASWRTYSPSSLIYGDASQQSLPLECFDPSSKFQWLSTLFTALGDVPVGNYLLRPHDAPGQSTFGKKRGGVEVLMATSEPGIESAEVDLYDFLPKSSEDQTQSLTISDSKVLRHSVLPSWNLRDRIPYTYQTGMYCLPFFLEGVCPTVSKGESCDHIHLRLSEQKVKTKTSVKTKRWRFENYTKVLKKAARSNFEWLDQPKLVTLNYAFCGEEKPAPATPSLADLYAPRHCRKPPAECPLPHFTLHQ